MKKIAFLTGLIVITLFIGCSKLAQFTNINVNIPYTGQVSVPQIADTTGLPSGGLSVTFPAYAVATNSQAYIDSYKTSTANILRVNLSTLTMYALPSSTNFNFIDSVQVYVYGQSLPSQLIAYNYNIAKGLDSLSLDTVSNTNLKQYFLLDTMYIQLTAHFISLPQGNAQLSINSIFHLLANPLG